MKSLLRVLDMRSPCSRMADRERVRERVGWLVRTKKELASSWRVCLGLEIDILYSVSFDLPLE
jgi:hypothetical protein